MDRIPFRGILASWIVPLPRPARTMARTRQNRSPVAEPQLPVTPSPARGVVPPDAQRRRSAVESSDVLVSAVISTYLLTHLHHVLQRAEYGAQQEGRPALAANYAQLRKVLCLDARTMEDASASGMEDEINAA